MVESTFILLAFFIETNHPNKRHSQLDWESPAMEAYPNLGIPVFTGMTTAGMCCLRKKYSLS